MGFLVAVTGMLGVSFGTWMTRNRKSESLWPPAVGISPAQPRSPRKPNTEPRPATNTRVLSRFNTPVEEDEFSLPETLPQVEELQGNDLNHFADLTDFMLRTGHQDRAAEFLEEFVDESPTQAIVPWIKLLNFYKAQGREEDFKWLAEQLHQHFNVAQVHWEDSEDTANQALLGSDRANEIAHFQPQSLEEIPHLCNAVVDVWGKPECPGYLETLLRDARGGKRQGFSLAVVQEILFLHHLALFERGGTTPLPDFA